MPAAGLMRGFERQVQAGLLALLLLLPLGASAQSGCPASGTSHATIADIDERLEITLRDGRRLRLAGLEPPRPTPDAPDFETQARDALKAQAGDEISFVPLDRPDRWGRIPVFAFFDRQPAESQSAGVFLLAHGFARYMPEAAARPCRIGLLGAESGARAAKLGLWRDPFYEVLAPDEREAFTERAATNVIVEGRLQAVINGPRRITLAFTPRGEHGFSVTILQRNVKIFERAGWDFHALIGRVLRVRGLLDLRFGPQIEISDADGMELIPEAQTDRAMGPDAPKPQ